MASPLSQFLSRLVREPLVHFILLGAGLFALTQFNQNTRNQAALQIVVTQERIAALASAWEIQQGSPPNPDQLQSLVLEDVQEEILAREAMAMGLGENDKIIRRRLAQKLRFLLSDASLPQTADETSLRDYYETHAELYTARARISFRHIYFSGTSRPAPSADATAQLAASDGETPLTGDPFFLPARFEQATEIRIRSDFGPAFWSALQGLPEGEWAGPVSSGFGAHLVFIEARAPEILRPFEEVREQVATDWQTAQQTALTEQRLQDILARYSVEFADGVLQP